VQGVAYRAWTVATARELGLSGWVRNLSDGNVEVVFSGDENKIFTMLEKCKDGPPAAIVKDVKKYSEKENPSPGFHQLPSL